MLTEVILHSKGIDKMPAIVLEDWYFQSGLYAILKSGFWWECLLFIYPQTHKIYWKQSIICQIKIKQEYLHGLAIK